MPANTSSSQCPPSAGASDQDAAFEQRAHSAEIIWQSAYQELKRIAASLLRHESSAHTLTPTGLTHETWLRMSGQQRALFKDRGHYLATASMMMRRILVNHAKAKLANKRNAQLVNIDDVDAAFLGSSEHTAPLSDDSLLRIHSALERLAVAYPRAAQVVEMRFFGDVQQEDIGVALDCGLATVQRDWQFARIWLHRELNQAGIKAQSAVL